MSLLLGVLGQAIIFFAGAYMAILFARAILGWLRFFKPSMRPRGIFLLAANALYFLTDPPLRVLNRYIPTLRLGRGMALDIGFMVLFLIVILIERIGLQLLNWSVVI